MQTFQGFLPCCSEIRRPVAASQPSTSNIGKYCGFLTHDWNLECHKCRHSKIPHLAGILSSKHKILENWADILSSSPAV